MICQDAIRQSSSSKHCQKRPPCRRKDRRRLQFEALDQRLQFNAAPISHIGVMLTETQVAPGFMLQAFTGNLYQVNATGQTLITSGVTSVEADSQGDLAILQGSGNLSFYHAGALHNVDTGVMAFNLSPPSVLLDLSTSGAIDRYGPLTGTQRLGSVNPQIFSGAQQFLLGSDGSVDVLTTSGSLEQQQLGRPLQSINQNVVQAALGTSNNLFALQSNGVLQEQIGGIWQNVDYFVQSFQIQSTGVSLNDWFSQNLPDLGVQNAARIDYVQHQSITRTDMLQIFAEVAQDGVVTSSEVTSLRNLVNGALVLHMPDYVFDLASKVVNNNPANRFCASQFDPSGNLYAGASSQVLGLLVNDWFLGGGSISWSGTGLPYGPVYGNTSLFGPAGPVFTDVYQGALGDCTLMASMAEVAARRPDLIRDMFIANGDGTYTVRLFVNGGPDYVTVNDDLVAYGNEFAHVVNGVLWPALLEKAIVEENESGMLATLAPGSNSYAAINNGNAGTALAYLGAISGLPVGQCAVNPSSVATAWSEGDLVVLGSGNTPDPLYIEHNHCYAMIGYNRSSSMPFMLFNPWGISGGHDASGQFYYGEVEVNGGALDTYFNFAALASSSSPNNGGVSSSIDQSGTDGLNSGARAIDAGEYIRPENSAQQAIARQQLFSAWGATAEEIDTL